MVAGRLTERPERPRLLQWAAELKISHDDAKKRLHESKDPDEQSRNKLLRLNRLKDQCETYATKLREAYTDEEEAAKRANVLREKSHANKAEIEQLRIEAGALQSGQPASMVSVVETMWSNYAVHFANPALSQSVKEKKAEVEAAFTTMATLL